MDYLISYTMQNTRGNGMSYRTHHVFGTDNLAEILPYIFQHHRPLGPRELKQYEENGYIHLGTPGDWWLMKDIEIVELPKLDRDTLLKYRVLSIDHLDV